MEIFLPSNPLIQRHIQTKSISNIFNNLVENATDFNIATGFVTNDSIAALKQIVEFREGKLKLSLFIGMNYLEGFTKPQYIAVRELNNYLLTNNLGAVYLSPKALYHGKMYSFMKNSICLASFIGSSNLGSFVGTSQNYIEVDAQFVADDGAKVNNYIYEITHSLGETFNNLPEVNNFIANDTALLKGYSFVKKLSREQLNYELANKTGEFVDIPLKTEAKSNLNTYFGKGKIKGKYSPRGWYEVEIILSKKMQNRDLIPTKDDGPFTVITNDGYEFQCLTQGDYSKNFRSEHDLKILGRWIKGQMENEGVLQIGTPITPETLSLFGKGFLRLEKTKDGKFILSLV